MGDEKNMTFEQRHKNYMSFVDENKNIDSSIFWHHLRKQFETKFVNGKAEVLGEWGKTYDPRIGSYACDPGIKDRCLMFLSWKSESLSRKLRARVDRKTLYKKAYDKFCFEDSLPEGAGLYSHDILRIGKNCAVHPQVIRMFSYFSMLFEHCKHFTKDDQVMEIGAGSGILGVLFHDRFKSKYIIVDLPEMVGFSSAMVATFLPEAKILLPNEIRDSVNFEDAHFIFLTPDQTDVLTDDSVSLSVNIHSFMEMKAEEIDTYFQLIQRVSRPEGLFFTENRYEKVPGFGDVEKRSFFDYPWDKNNEDIFLRVSDFHEEIKHHLMFTRLQRIHK